MTKDNFPIISEQLIIENETTKSTQTQLQASDILKTKQLIPHNFIQLETKAKNYMCSTEGWKEPVCERYGFTYEGKWIQLDIPCEVVEKLELSKRESITYPVYVSSELLNKEPEFGGITLGKEDEVFLLKPLTKDEGVQTEVSGEDIQNLEEQNKEKDKQITQLNQKVEEQARRIRELEIVVAEKKSQRGWKGFYDWLNSNIFDNRKIRTSRVNDYPHLAKNEIVSVDILLVGLEHTLKISSPSSSFSSWNTPLLPYDDNKNFFQLANGESDGKTFTVGWRYSGSTYPTTTLPEFEKLLAEWRRESS